MFVILESCHKRKFQIKKVINQEFLKLKNVFCYKNKWSMDALKKKKIFLFLNCLLRDCGDFGIFLNWSILYLIHILLIGFYQAKMLFL